MIIINNVCIIILDIKCVVVNRVLDTLTLIIEYNTLWLCARRIKQNSIAINCCFEFVISFKRITLSQLYNKDANKIM